MARYFLTRAGHFVFIVFGISVIVFLCMRLVPGDPITYLAGPFANEAQRQQIRASYGLDQPLATQYVKWLGKAVQGDLGQSMQLHVPVLELLLTKWQNSLLLIAGSMLAAILIGWPLGILSGFRPDSIWDRMSQLIALSGISLPAFWFGMLLVMGFAINLPWFPAAGIVSERGGGGIVDVVWHLVLPSLATAALPAGMMIRMTRSAILEVRQQPFVSALAAKGLPRRVVVAHVLRNAMPTILNVTGMQAGFLLTAAIFTEVVFTWPGLGLQIFTAVTAQDYPVAQGAVLFICVMFLVFNIIVDVLRPLCDPRIRFG